MIYSFNEYVEFPADITALKCTDVSVYIYGLLLNLCNILDELCTLYQYDFSGAKKVVCLTWILLSRILLFVTKSALDLC